MDSTARVGCRSGRAITREALPSWIRVDGEGHVWTAHDRRGFDAPERRAEREHQRGYLTVSLPDHRGALAHRVVYAWHNGEAPAGVLIRHSNDNRTDNRPENLALGTAQDNSDDARRNGSHTGNHARGVLNVNAKMTPEKVREMRRAYANGATQMEMAAAYGIRQATVWAILHRKTWANVPD
jgi:hypothetical protein